MTVREILRIILNWSNIWEKGKAKCAQRDSSHDRL